MGGSNGGIILADSQRQAYQASKETRHLDQRDGLSVEATRVLPLEETQQPGQVAIGDGNAGLGQSEGQQSTAAAPRGSSVGRRLALNTLIVGGAFVLSRVLGLLRDMALANEFGATEVKSSYDAAFRIPDTLFLLIIGGAVGSAFIPVFTKLMSDSKEERAWQLASTLINASVVLLSLGALLLSLLAPALVPTVITSGQQVDQALVIELTQIMLLSPLLMGLGGWAMGILNARQHFTLPALAPIAYNLAIIFGAVVLAGYFDLGIHSVAWSVVLGAALHFGVQVPGLVRAGMRYRLRLNVRDEGVGEVGRLIGPRILGQAAFQANTIGATNIASHIATGTAAVSAIAVFGYAYLLMILPHGVFAMSLATVTFPTMTAQYAEGNFEGLRGTLLRAIRVLLFLTLPSAVGMYVLREPLVAALFQSGEFGPISTVRVADTLGFFALGLVAYAVVEVVTRAFYALHDTRTPVTIAILTVALNLALSAFLVFGLSWNETALALSLAVTTTIEMVLLWLYLGRKLPGWRISNDGLLPSMAKSGVAALVMGVVLFFAVPLLAQVVGSPLDSRLSAIVLTALGIVLGSVIYAGAALLLRSEELGDALKMVLKRRRGS